MQLIKTLFLSTLAFSMLSACSNHQQILVDTPAKAREDFRLTRPIATPRVNTLSPTFVEAKPLNLVLGIGDKVVLHIHQGEEMNGTYTIDVDGYLKLPYLQPIYAQGLTIQLLEDSVKQSLVLEQIFQSEFLTITITPARWSAAFINVKGAVYKPGNTLINERDFKKESIHSTSNSGDFVDKRLLSSALKAAGGLRPDADLSRIQLVRANQRYQYDFRGLLSGDGVSTDPILINGDRIIVPSVGFLQKELFQLSRITPPGFRVFLSNLTVPATSNNTSAIGKFSSNLPLGSRLLTAAMSANCIGGTQSVNAKRHVVLAGIDIKTNMLHVTQKSIQELLANPNADQVNPYLLPNDHVACFDSSVTNWRDIGRAISDILSPVKILGSGL